MIYQLKNGRAVHLTTERFLNMSDDDLEKLELYGVGSEISDPFYGSVIESKGGRCCVEKEQVIEDTEELLIPLGDFNLPDDLDVVEVRDDI